MDISINLADGVPIYRQIADQLRYMVASGLLEPGDELPSIRTLALKLRVTPNTVVKAYDELVGAGAIEKRHGAGTFVSGTRLLLARQERQRIIDRRIDRLLAEAHQLGYTPDELLEAVRRRQAALIRHSEPEEADERKYG